MYKQCIAIPNGSFRGTGVENMMEMCGQCNFTWLMANVLDAETGDVLHWAVFSHKL